MEIWWKRRIRSVPHACARPCRRPTHRTAPLRAEYKRLVVLRKRIRGLTLAQAAYVPLRTAWFVGVPVLLAGAVAVGAGDGEAGTALQQ